MSILIKGMKMPKAGNWKTIRVYYDGTCVEPNWQGDCKVMKGCEAVHIPLHGVLIDRDAMAEDLAYDIEMDEKALDDTDIVGIEREKLQFDKDCKQNCMHYLTEQKPIIPAERE